MTWSDYEKIAAVFKSLTREDQDGREYLLDAAWRLSDVFKADNSRFKSEVFLTACGFESHPEGLWS